MEGEDLPNHDRKKHQVTMIREIVKVGPFLVLTGDGLAFVASFFEWYNDFQWFHSQIVGHGVFMVIMWIFYAHVHRYCMYSIISLYTLFALNILNIAYFFVNLIYYQVYAGIIIFGGLALSVLYLLKRCRKHITY